jgi:hypothetical protein
LDQNYSYKAPNALVQNVQFSRSHILSPDGKYSKNEHRSEDSSHNLLPENLYENKIKGEEQLNHQKEETFQSESIPLSARKVSYLEPINRWENVRVNPIVLELKGQHYNDFKAKDNQRDKTIPNKQTADSKITSRLMVEPLNTSVVEPDLIPRTKGRPEKRFDSHKDVPRDTSESNFTFRELSKPSNAKRDNNEIYPPKISENRLNYIIPEKTTEELTPQKKRSDSLSNSQSPLSKTRTPQQQQEDNDYIKRIEDLIASTKKATPQKKMEEKDGLDPSQASRRQLGPGFQNRDGSSYLAGHNDTGEDGPSIKDQKNNHPKRVAIKEDEELMKRISGNIQAYKEQEEKRKAQEDESSKNDVINPWKTEAGLQIRKKEADGGEKSNENKSKIGSKREESKETQVPKLRVDEKKVLEGVEKNQILIKDGGDTKIENESNIRKINGFKGLSEDSSNHGRIVSNPDSKDKNPIASGHHSGGSKSNDNPRVSENKLASNDPVSPRLDATSFEAKEIEEKGILFAFEEKGKWLEEKDDLKSGERSALPIQLRTTKEGSNHFNSQHGIPKNKKGSDQSDERDKGSELNNSPLMFWDKHLNEFPKIPSEPIVTGWNEEVRDISHQHPQNEENQGGQDAVSALNENSEAPRPDPVATPGKKKITPIQSHTVTPRSISSRKGSVRIPPIPVLRMPTISNLQSNSSHEPDVEQGSIFQEMTDYKPLAMRVKQDPDEDDIPDRYLFQFGSRTSRSNLNEQDPYNENTINGALTLREKEGPSEGVEIEESRQTTDFMKKLNELYTMYSSQNEDNKTLFKDLVDFRNQQENQEHSDRSSGEQPNQAKIGGGTTERLMNLDLREGISKIEIRNEESDRQMSSQLDNQDSESKVGDAEVYNRRSSLKRDKIPYRSISFRDFVHNSMEQHESIAGSKEFRSVEDFFENLLGLGTKRGVQVPSTLKKKSEVEQLNCQSRGETLQSLGMNKHTRKDQEEVFRFFSNSETVKTLMTNLRAKPNVVNMGTQGKLSLK